MNPNADILASMMQCEGGEMTKRTSLVPFLLRFAEVGAEPDYVVDVFYDPELSLNVLMMPDGSLRPAVHALADGTATFTEVRSERTDTDPQDDRAATILDPTITGTRVREENSDTDPHDVSSATAGANHWTHYGRRGPDTTTFTKVKSDVTDRD